MARRLRAVVDTNVWVSAFVSAPSAPFRIVNAALAGEFIPVSSGPLLAELEEVLNRPSISSRHHHSAEQIAEFVDDIAAVSLVVAVNQIVLGCRDRKDDVVVETALVGAADFLVSLDKDFLGSPSVVEALANGGAAILTPNEFAAELALLSLAEP